MTIKGFRYFPFNSELPYPLVTSTGVLKRKEGFIVSVTDENNLTYFGEAAPLPIWGGEKLQEIRDSFELLRDNLLDKSFKPGKEALTSILNFNVSPSARFAIESVMLQFAFERERSSDLFAGLSFSDTIKINALIGGEDEINQTLKEIISNGFDTVKLKIGANDFERDLKRIEQIRKSSNNKIKLRLDANGKWTLNEAKEYLGKLSEFNVEYIEEPVSGIKEMIKLSDISPVPIAVDESLTNLDDAFALLNSKSINHFVIKPTRFGSVIRLFDFILSAGNAGKFVIISSALETVVGKGFLAFIASAVNHNAAHGLGIVSNISGVDIDDPFPIERGNISLKNFPPIFSLEGKS